MSISIHPHPPRRRKQDSSDFDSHDVTAGDYVGFTRGADQYGIWRHEGGRLKLIGGSADSPRSIIDLADGVPMKESIRQHPQLYFNDPVIHRMTLSPGTFYARMARPEFNEWNLSPGRLPTDLYRNYDLTATLLQLRSLIARLESVLTVVHPSSDNLDVFGIEIRNLLILSATEVEAQWRGVLVANHYGGSQKTRFSTNDYVKLAAAMRLPEYAFRFRLFPFVEEVAPFANWCASGSPTKDIAWYDAYNKVKHDRSGSFHEAKLTHAMFAIVACWTMVAAQFGFRGMRELSDLDNYFEMTRVPRWRFSEVYSSRFSDELPPTSNGEIDYPFP